MLFRSLDPKERESIVAEAERLHLSDDEFNRLMKEAKAEFEKSLAAQELSFGQLMLDANAHPEFAAEQFRILVAQQRLLVQAIGAPRMISQLADTGTAGELAPRVARVIAEHEQVKTRPGSAD